MSFRKASSSLLLAALMLGTAPGAGLAAGLVLPVPATTIYPGETIDDSMITERTVKSSRIGRLLMVAERAALVGKVARRTLLPGRPVPANAVAVPDLVPRGAPVAILFREGGLTILAQAMSLEAGSEGDVIKVRNVDSGLMVNATVQADGTVRVGTH